MDSPFYPPPATPEPPRPAWASARVLTAIIGIPLVLLIVWLGGAPFRLLCLVLALIAMRELQVAIRKSNALAGANLIGIVAYPAIILAVCGGITTSYPWAIMTALLTLSVVFYGRGTRLTLPSLAITLLATLYVGLFALLPTLRSSNEGQLLYLTIFTVWASDTAAYYGGKAFGRTPFSPLSPGKTREGALCGFAAAILVAAIIAGWFQFSTADSAAMAFIIAVAAPLGDLAESFWKRELGVKDLGTILPGHGGILDRCDSLLFAALGLSLYFALCGIPEPGNIVFKPVSMAPNAASNGKLVPLAAHPEAAPKK